MTDNEINLAVARACGYAVDEDRLVVTKPGGFGERVSRTYDPRNDDAQAIAALERYVGVNGKWTIKRDADSLLIGFTHPVTRKWFQHLDWGEDERAKLSHAITDAILAAQEKRNA